MRKRSGRGTFFPCPLVFLDAGIYVTILKFEFGILRELFFSGARKKLLTEQT